MYIKHNKVISDKNELASVVRNFAVEHCGFTDEGSIGSANQFSLRKAGSWFFNFNFTDETIETTCTKTKPSITVRSGIDAIGSNVKTNNNFNYTVTYRLQFPLVSLHMIYTDGMVAIVMEIQNKVFRHHIFGQMHRFDTPTLTDFIGGTNSMYSPSNTSQQGVYYRMPDASTYNANFVTVSYLTSPFMTGYIQSSSRIISGAGSFVRDGETFIPNGFIGWGFSNARDNKVKMGSPLGEWSSNYVNDYNGRVQLAPCIIFYDYPLNTDGTRYPMTPYAYSNGVFLTNCRNIDAGEVIDDKFIVFPVVTKEAILTEMWTRHFGYAYKIK